jgi:hypothetical protein
MLQFFILAVLIIFHAPLNSKVHGPPYNDIVKDGRSNLLDRLEIAYYIANENKTAFFFPQRLVGSGLQHLCILFRLQDEILCSSLPNEPFMFHGRLQGIVRISWHLKYSFDSSNMTNSNTNTVDLHYNTVALLNLPKFSFRVEILSPSYGSLISKTLHIIYSVNTQGKLFLLFLILLLMLSSLFCCFYCYHCYRRYFYCCYNCYYCFQLSSLLLF